MEYVDAKRNIERYIEKIAVREVLPQYIFDSVEDVIRDYCNYEDYYSGQDSLPPIRHGERVAISKKEGDVSWHFNPIYDNEEHVTLSYRTEREWIDDCYIDEIPVNLLLYLLTLIVNRCPLMDQRPKEVIDKIRDHKEEQRLNKIEKAQKKAFAIKKGSGK